MLTFQLFLDESGDFEDPGSKKDISLVGGYLCPEGTFDPRSARQLLREAYQKHQIPLPSTRQYHAKDLLENKRISVHTCQEMLQTVMRTAWEKGGHLIAMQNRGRGLIINDDLTYLHLTAECIVRVMFRLARQQRGRKIHLHVVVSERRGRKFPDYERRIREHVAWGIYRLGISSLRQIKVGVDIHSALSHPCLMVADHVCFGIRGGLAWKKSAEFKEELDRHLLDEVVLEDGQSLSLRRNLQKRDFADAALEALLLVSLAGDCPLADEAKRALSQEIIPALLEMPSRYREYQFRRLFDSLDVRTNMLWRLEQGYKLLAALDEHILSRFRHRFQKGDIWIDFRFHQLCFGLANHRGDTVAARDHLDRALQLAPGVVRRWEMVPIWFDLKVDEAVFLTDAYDHAEAVNLLDGLEKSVRSLLDALQEAVGGTDEGPAYRWGVRADILGKICGARLQARFLAGCRNPRQYDLARQDSGLALSLFSSPQDLARQHLYRCHLETDAGELPEAVRFLGRALEVPEAEQEPFDAGGCAAAIGAVLAGKPAGPFPLRHWCRVWAATVKRDPDGKISRTMTDAWSRVFRQCRPTGDYLHPWEIVDWKAGAALMRTGKREEGRSRLNRATERCLGRDIQPPRYTIGLACLAEWAALEDEKERPALVKKLREKTAAILDDDTGEFASSLKAYFQPWRETVEGSPKPEDLISLSRDVAY